MTTSVRPLFEQKHFKLRPYQKAAHDGIRAAWRRGIKAMGVFMPTGTGKTGTMVNFAKDGCRCLFIAPQTELIKQWTQALSKHRKVSAEVEQAEQIADLDAFYFVATNQTLLSKLSDGSRRYEKFVHPPGHEHHIPVVVVDECDTFFSEHIRNMLRDFVANGSLVVGLTATPYRGKKGDSLFGFYEEAAYSMEIRDAFNEGWLVVPRLWSHEVTSVNLDAKKMGSRYAADFDPIELEQEMMREAPLQDVCNLIAKYHDPEKHLAIVRCAGKRQAKAISEMLNDRFNIKSGCVWGTQNKEERDATMKAFREGEITVLTNVRVVSRGVDIPRANQAFNAAPSKSKAAMMQFFGRFTRPVSDCISGCDTAEERKAAISKSIKPSWDFHDLTATTKYHSLVTAIHLLVQDKEVADNLAKNQEEDDEPLDVNNLDEEEQAERNRLADLARMEREAQRERKRQLVADVTFESTEIELFGRRDAKSPSRRCWRMPWHKYKGRPVRDPIISLEYLEWFFTVQTSARWIAVIGQEIERRKKLRDHVDGGAA